MNKLVSDRNIKDIGDVVGGKRCGEGWFVKHKGVTYPAHKIIWAMFNDYKSQRGLVIDHIDRDPFNNHPDNLRLVTVAVNSRNQKKRSTNKTGVMGVTFDGTGSGDGKIVTYYTKDGVQVRKSFSVRKYGYDEAVAMATEWRKERIEELNREGAGYTDDHGES